MTISWPLAQVFSVLTLCTTALVWHGTIPSHAFFAVGGAILGYLIPRAPSLSLAQARAWRAQLLVPTETEGFSKEEIPTTPGKRPDSNPSIPPEKK